MRGLSIAHPIIPLALLETVQALDAASADDDLARIAESVQPRKFGRTTTVGAQIRRYQDAVRQRKPIPGAEVTGLFVLCSRRRDADLVFSDAGRRAGRHASDLLAGWWGRTSGRMTGDTLQMRTLRRAARRAFDVVVESEGHARWLDTAGLGDCDVIDRMCDVWRHGMAELMRRLTAFDGALFHVSCRAHGASECVWSTRPIPESHDADQG